MVILSRLLAYKSRSLMHVTCSLSTDEIDALRLEHRTSIELNAMNAMNAKTSNVTVSLQTQSLLQTSDI